MLRYSTSLESLIRLFCCIFVGALWPGAGATLLATAFESWMVTEHHSQRYPSHLLADTFRMATWGIGLATIASGFVAEASVKGMDILAPFNVAIGVRSLGSSCLDKVVTCAGIAARSG